MMANHARIERSTQFLLALTQCWIAASVAAFSTILFISSASASHPMGGSGEGPACASLHSFVGETQIFDSTRTHLEEVAFDSPIRCGDWVGVENGRATIRLGSRSTGGNLLLSQGAFVQVLDPSGFAESSLKADLALYRGEFLVQAPQDKSVTVLTPNGLVRVESGGAFVIYSDSEESTQVVGLGGKATLENRFFTGRKVLAPFAQVVTFKDPIDRIVPDASRPVEAKDLSDRLARVGALPELGIEVGKAVKLASKAKMPVSLAPVSVPRDSGSMGGEFGASRGIASVADPIPAPVKKQVKTTRSPASLKSKEPDFRLKRKGSEADEKKRLLQALSTLSEDES